MTPTSPPNPAAATGRRSDTHHHRSVLFRFLLCLLLLSFADGVHAQLLKIMSISGPADAKEGDSGTRDLSSYTVSVTQRPSTNFTWRVCFSGTATRGDTDPDSDPDPDSDSDSDSDSEPEPDYWVINNNKVQISSCTGYYGFGPTRATSASIQIKIKVKGDTDPESDETVIAALSFARALPSDVILHPSYVIHTILDDDSTDTTAPRVSSIDRQTPSSSPTRADSLTWRVTFDEAVSNVDAADFSVSNTTAMITVSRVSGTNAYDVTASDGNLASLSSTVTLSFSTNHDIEDTAGNKLAASPTVISTNNNTYVVDNTAPRVTSITRQTPSSSPTDADSLTWRVTFGETVINVDTMDFDITGSGIGNVTRTVIRVPGTSAYDVTASGGNLTRLNATVTLSFADSQNIQDTSGNALTNTRPTGTNNNSYVITNTTSKPVITISAGTSPVTEGTAANFTVNANPAPSANLTIKLTVSENTSGGQDFVAAADEGSNKTVVINANQTSATYTVATTLDSTDEPNGSVMVTVDSGSSYTVGSTSSATITVNDDDDPPVTDMTAPQVTSIVHQMPSTSSTNANSLTWRVTFNEAVSNVDAADFSASNTSASLTAVAVSGTNAYDVTASGGNLAGLNATVTLSFASGHNIQDISGNALPTSPTPTNTNNNAYVVDNTAPRVTSIARQTPSSSPTNADNLTWRVTFNEAVSNVDAADFSVSNTTASLAVVTVSGTNAYDVTASGGNLAGLNATVTLSFVSSPSIEDTAGNTITNTAPTGTNNNSYVMANNTPPPSKPVITISAGTSPVTEGTAASFTVNANPAPAANLTVNLTVSENTSNGRDFVAAANEGSNKTAIINANQTSATYAVATTPDSTDEPNGNVTVTVDSGSDYTVGSANSASITVNDDDTTTATPDDGSDIVVSIFGGRGITEGEHPSWTVVANKPADRDVTVDLSVSDVSGSDFLHSTYEGSAEVTIMQGQISAVFDNVMTQGDGTQERSGDLIVTLMPNPNSPYTLGASSSAQVAVFDDDDPNLDFSWVVLGPPAYSVKEGSPRLGDPDRERIFPVRLDGVSTLDGRSTRDIMYEVCFSGSATQDTSGNPDSAQWEAGADYQILRKGTVKTYNCVRDVIRSGSTAFSNNRNIAIKVKADDDVENDETVTATITSLTPGVRTLNNNPATYTIRNDDTDTSVRSPGTGPAVQVPDTQVSNVQASAIDDASTTVIWDAVPHATGYSVEWEGESADQQDYVIGFKSVTGTSATFDHNAPQALTLTVTVMPEYLDGNGQVRRLPALAGTATLEVGLGGTQGANTQTIAPNTCVSTGLQSDVEGYAQENYGAAHVARWKKVLKTFAGETGGMTGTEARQMEKTYSASRWVPVAEAIECLEAADQPVAVPEVTVSGGNGVTEGDPASFTITADPAPTAPLDVTLTVGQSGDFAAGTTGSREVTVPTGGSVTLDIATVDDTVDEPDGSVSVTVDAGDGYTVAASPDDTASVAVADDDNAPANAYAALITKMYTWRNDPKWGSYRSHTDRWDRALLAFGESVADSSLTPMTAAEAEAFADRGWTRWVEVAQALNEIESGETVTPDPVPVVTVSGGTGVTEGNPASFTVTANPAPTAPLAVTLTVGQSGDFVAGATGAREITVPPSGSVTLDIATVDDSTDESDGSVSVTIDAGNGYTVGSANVHTVSVADDDTTPASVPELSLAAGSAVDEGGNAEFTITANPAPQADLMVQFTVIQSGDYLSVPPSSRTVTLTAGTTGTTVSLSTVEDGTDEAHGSVSMTIDTGTDYTVAPGQASGSVTVRDNDDPPAVPVVSIAAGNAVTEGDPASFTITANPAPASPLTVALTMGQDGDFAAGTISEVTVPTGGSVTVDIATDNDDVDEPDGSVSVTVDAGSDYTVAASPHNTASVAVADNDDPASVPSLSVVDGKAHENQGRVPVIIRLNPPSKNPVSVWVTLRESNPVSAQEGVDYKTWGRFGFRTTFRPGETERRFAVAVINDSHDEDAETFEVVLSDPSGGAAISDGVGVMTIVNSDPMPAAWLARFGRTVAEQTLDGISGRMAASRTAGTRGSLAGQTLSFGNGGETDREDVLDRFGHNGFHVDPRNPDDGESRNLSGNDLLSGSRFTSTGEQDGSGGSLAFWGRGAQSNFDGREGTFSLDGETTTTMLGADYARDNWLVGLALTRSSGKGDYRDNGTGPQCPDDSNPSYLCNDAVQEGNGKVKASLTAAIPYAAIQASEGLKLWGALGYGSGEITLKPEPGKNADENAVAKSYKSDIDWTMMAVGGRSELLPLPREGSGPAVTLTGDALWARTESEKTTSLAASDSDVTRLRLGLEGSWRIATEGDGSITPKLELGVRQDGGDAETGSGMELGAGIAWRDPGLGLSLDLSGRTLITHTDEDLENEGYSVSFHYDPRPASARGLALSLSQEIGGPAAGGLDALFAPEPLSERPDSDDDSRLKLEAAYGFPTFWGRYISSPGVSFGRASGSRDYGLGWHFTPVKNASRVSFGVKATRRESEGASSENAVGVEVALHW